MQLSEPEREYVDREIIAPAMIALRNGSSLVDVLTGAYLGGLRQGRGSATVECQKCGKTVHPEGARVWCENTSTDENACPFKQRL